VDGVKLLGMGFHDIQGLVLSHLWVPLLRASDILFLFMFLEQIFSKPFIIHIVGDPKLKKIRGTKMEIHSPHIIYLGLHAFPS
jgi:hypothetical protein